jgi:thiol-disulfide isomerase/thioredoxin
VATPDTPSTPEPTATTGTRILSALATQQAIAATPGPVLINHWATWCEGCVEELPLLVELHKRFGTEVTFLGISWETFQFEREDTVAHVQAFAQEQGVLWDSLIVQDRPDRLFETLEMRCQTVPQVWVLAADGQVLYRCEQVLDADECKRLADVLKQVSS